MNYSNLEKLIEEIVLESFGRYVRCLPTSERTIFSLYLEGRTAPQIVHDLEGTCSLPFVNRTIKKVKEQLKARYYSEVATRCV